MSDGGATLGSIRRMAARRLAAALSSDDTPALDARLLIAAAVGLDADRLVLADYRAVTPAEAAVIERYLERRIAGEPVARIIGAKEFWGLPFVLAPETLVPRPDTETLVEAVLAYFDRRGGRERPFTLVDIGTGTGAILISLLTELPSTVGIGVDLSEGAARQARDNAEALGVADRSLFIKGLWGLAAGQADVIVSNPPYIVSSIIETLDATVKDHDPRLALDGGPDGLDAYRAIIADLDRIMAPGGAAFLEIGYDQAATVAALLAEGGFEAMVHRDLAGHDRVLEISRVSDGITIGSLGVIE
ncbi:peptide chain release factor N(5)-glutamine methyltransferase [Kaistia dalseonensis]|uniref:Release factor glutamine methyltransferase n=1 Tax=Kaistia dalseonensis TaxID=410840 RepID=A0ABU0H3J1_9HYPH|nr:peptide chain release factor N(5)-glutamine methyltransferase [Kaistia dalseonensis]MCX5494285.1 peptide chain release factor N(5)-glutamine methyltransferase [Kaistia dalseonensis]MDQ0436866.1 release factor glutamine methyltransferase [Kaistia dalseonensis]